MLCFSKLGLSHSHGRLIHIWIIVKSCKNRLLHTKSSLFTVTNSNQIRSTVHENGILINRLIIYSKTKCNTIRVSRSRIRNHHSDISTRNITIIQIKLLIDIRILFQSFQNLILHHTSDNRGIQKHSKIVQQSSCTCICLIADKQNQRDGTMLLQILEKVTTNRTTKCNIIVPRSNTCQLTTTLLGCLAQGLQNLIVDILIDLIIKHDVIHRTCTHGIIIIIDIRLIGQRSINLIAINGIRMSRTVLGICNRNCRELKLSVKIRNHIGNLFITVGRNVDNLLYVISQDIRIIRLNGSCSLIQLFNHIVLYTIHHLHDFTRKSSIERAIGHLFAHPI